jgi:hypothetical protein
MRGRRDDERYCKPIEQLAAFFASSIIGYLAIDRPTSMASD